MTFYDIYKPMLRLKVASMVSGVYETEVEAFIGDGIDWDIPIIKAFMKDNDIQEITVVSSNIGFVRTLTKQYKPREANA